MALFSIFEAFSSLHIQRLTFKFVHCSESDEVVVVILIVFVAFPIGVSYCQKSLIGIAVVVVVLIL